MPAESAECTDWAAAIEEVLKITRECATEHFVALYTWGSATTGEMDPWSDLDVCLVQADTAKDDPSVAQDWKLSVLDAFEHQVDPSAILMEQLRAGAPRDFAGYQWGLKRTGRLLLGEDIRAQIAEPTAEELRLAVVNLAFLCLRRLYSIPREKPLPDPLPLPEARLARFLPWRGNIAWQVVATALQVLRALLAIDHGVFCETKSQIASRLRQVGEGELIEVCERVGEIRRTASPVGDLTEIPPAVEPLRLAIPPLFHRLLATMAAHGLQDPSYEPKEGQAPAG